MALSVNLVVLGGNLTRDPETKFLPSGTCVSKMRLAVNRRFKAGSGEFKEEVAYVNVETWGRTAEHCAERFRKGSCVLVIGRMKQHDWTTADGQKRSEIEISADRVQGADGKDARHAEDMAAEAGAGLGGEPQ